MSPTFTRPESLTDARTHYCGGCGHGVAHRLVAEVIDQLGVRERTVGVAPVGCAVLAYDYFRFDVTEAAHGRTPAVATGIKRVLPDRVVFTYQGDGDLAAIGTAEIIHAANRGEAITVIFINNGIYGMTQGQMAPTTLVGQKTTTTPRGRNIRNEGHPIRVCELLNALEAPLYLERVALSSPRNVRRARKAILNGFRAQIEHNGFALIELLSACPTYWRMSPAACMKRIEEEMVPVFPVGIIRDRVGLEA
jgi:2-oxoglutarate ferredoxin oxidoreductase subunit beta